jgi:hypothetical protein
MRLCDCPAARRANGEGKERISFWALRGQSALTVFQRFVFAKSCEFCRDRQPKQQLSTTLADLFSLNQENARFKFHYGHGLNSAFASRALSSILSISYPPGSGA